MNSSENPFALRDTQTQDRMLDPPRFWKRHRLLAGVILSLILGCTALMLAFYHFRGIQDSVDRARVTISTVERGSFVRDVVADGQVVAAVSPTLYVPSSGTVSLKVHAGDAVEHGAVVAVIESADLTARLSQEEATLQNLLIDWKRSRLDADHKLAESREAYSQAEIDLNTSQREVDRSRKAFDMGAYPEIQVLRSEDALEKARFAFERAKANYVSQPQQNRFDTESKRTLLDRQQFLVADLRRQIEALQIRSPVTGKVGYVQVEDRASVSKDAPLLTVVDLTALQVEIKVPESLARDLTVGMAADLEGNGLRWKGAVSAVSPQVINGEVSARVRFADRTPEGLRQNQRLSVRIFIDRRENVLMVDRGPFLDQEGGNFVYVVRNDVAERRTVRLGPAGVQKVEVLEGLSVGDRIVVSGTEAFRGSQRVMLSH
jgi:HlyD family secretion protein